MPDLDRVPDRPFAVDREPAAAAHPVVVALRQLGCGARVARQQAKEGLEAGCIEREALRELPQHRAELLVQGKHTGGEEVGERCLDVLELLHVGDEAPALEGEHEAGRRLGMPGAIQLGPLQGIEAAVNLDRVEALRGIAQLVALAQPLGIEAATPTGVAPTRDADANRGLGRFGGHAPTTSGAAVVLSPSVWPRAASWPAGWQRPSASTGRCPTG